MNWSTQYSPRPAPQPQRTPVQTVRESLQKQLNHGGFILLSSEQAKLVIEQLERK